MTRMTVVLNTLGWREGTLAEVQEECGNCLERPVSIMEMTDAEFTAFIEELRRSYAPWINFHKGEEQ